MGKKKTRTFPHEILVSHVEEQGIEYLQVHEDAVDAAELGEVVQVAKYRLVEIGEVRADATYTPRKG